MTVTGLLAIELVSTEVAASEISWDLCRKDKLSSRYYVTRWIQMARKMLEGWILSRKDVELDLASVAEGGSWSRLGLHQAK